MDFSDRLISFLFQQDSPLFVSLCGLFFHISNGREDKLFCQSHHDDKERAMRNMLVLCLIILRSGMPAWGKTLLIVGIVVGGLLVLTAIAVAHEN
jgi:hypothetical protein